MHHTTLPDITNICAIIILQQNGVGGWFHISVISLFCILTLVCKIFIRFLHKSAIKYASVSLTCWLVSISVEQGLLYNWY